MSVWRIGWILFALWTLWERSVLFAIENTEKKSAITVAFLSAQSGQVSFSDREMIRGAKVFENHFPKVSEILKIDFLDNRGTIEGTLAALKKSREREYPIVLGVRDNEQALATAQIAEEGDFLFFSPLANLSKITQGKKNSFQLSANEVLVGAALARFVKQDLKRSKILLLVNTRSVYSQALAHAFERGLHADSDIKIQQHVSNGEALDLEALRKKLKSFQPDLVFISDSFHRSAVLAKYIHKIDPFLPFLTGEPMGNEVGVRTILREAPKIRLYFSSFWQKHKKVELNEEFKKGYRKMYPKQNPSGEAASSYDALLILSKAVSLTGGVFSLDKVRYFLEHQEFETTQGVIHFYAGPTHSPVRDLQIKVTDTHKSKTIKRLKTRWKSER